MIAFTEKSLGKSRIMQARSGSSSSNSLNKSGMMTSTGVGKVVLIWGIGIPKVAHFLFLSLEAYKSSSWVCLDPKLNLPSLSESSMRVRNPRPTVPRPWPSWYPNLSISLAAIRIAASQLESGFETSWTMETSSKLWKDTSRKALESM